MAHSKHVTDEMIINACKNSLTMRMASINVGLHFNTFKRRALKLNCYNANQGGKGTNKKPSKIYLS